MRPGRSTACSLRPTPALRSAAESPSPLVALPGFQHVAAMLNATTGRATGPVFR